MTERDEILRDLGKQTAQIRESRGITLEDVFDKTRIRMEYLRGIEAGDYSNFPELVYVKGFVRTYLSLIGAEDLQEDFMNQLDQNRAGKKHEQNVTNILRNGSSLPEGFKPASHFWLFLVLIGALIGTALYVWYAISYGGIDVTNLKLFRFSGNGGEVPVIQVDIVSDDVSEEVSGDENAQNISGDVESADQKTEVPQKNMIQVQAINDVWLKITIGQNVVFSRTMKRGDSGSWELTAPATIRFGRATAAQVIVNGKDLGVPNPRAKGPETYIYNPDGTFRKAGK